MMYTFDKNIQYCIYKFVIDDNTEETREEEKTSWD